MTVEGYEKVIEAKDEASGLHAFLAVHSTHLGPALGGTRIYPYAAREEAITDVLRLSKGMTYKSAVVDIGLGGGKSVIIADPKKEKSAELLEAFGEAVNALEGSYICAEDVGSTAEDMAIIRRKTRYVAALPYPHGSGDPGPFTAWGVFRGVQAVSRTLWNTDILEGCTVAIQGLGSVGEKLAELLFWHGAELIFSDVDAEKVKRLAFKYGAKVVEPQDFFGVTCDILAPCALGGVLNDETIPNLKCRAVAGAANNQLLRPEHGEELFRRNILYAPDYVINAGGVVNVSMEFQPEGYQAGKAKSEVDQIYYTLREIFKISEERSCSTHRAADELAEYNLDMELSS